MWSRPTQSEQLNRRIVFSGAGGGQNFGQTRLPHQLYGFLCCSAGQKNQLMYRFNFNIKCSNTSLWRWKMADWQFTKLPTFLSVLVTNWLQDIKICWTILTTLLFLYHFYNPSACTSPTTVVKLGQLKMANWQAQWTALISIQQSCFSALALGC